MLISWIAGVIGAPLLLQADVPIAVTLDAEAVCSHGRAKFTVDQFPPLEKRERVVELSYNGRPVARSGIEQIRQRISNRTIDQISVLDCGEKGAGMVRFVIALPTHLGTEGQRPIVFSVSQNTVSFD